MAGIFINYRRDDSPGVAGRLFDYLTLKFSRRDLFMDVDAMKAGVDFAKQLDAQVTQCRVLLAVIGSRWLDIKDQGGERRLDNDRDYVRIELACALKRDIPVIPLLVDGAVMPAEESLPDDLKPLARRHALELRHTRFNADADAIVRAIETIIPRSRARWTLLAGGGMLAAGIAAAVIVGPRLMAKLHPPAAPPNVTTGEPPTPTQPNIGSTGLPPGIKLGELLPDVALPGSLYRVFEVTPAEPTACQSVCRAETRCVAWTYTQPQAPNQPAHCSLKPLIPGPVTNNCCTSGVERVPELEMREPPPLPASMPGALRGVELEGGTYRYLTGSDATPERCQAACRAEGQCLEWDYVRPGVYSADARCFLKNKVAAQHYSPCCIAGIERPAATSPGPQQH